MIDETRKEPLQNMHAQTVANVEKVTRKSAVATLSLRLQTQPSPVPMSTIVTLTYGNRVHGAQASAKCAWSNYVYRLT